jgi:imidazole glycerol-phosphate synthase subunit HisH
VIGIINYGSGNILAIQNVFRAVNAPVRIVESAAELDRCDRLVLPGVGAFDATMTELNATGFRDALEHHVIDKHKPCLGVCVGMQILGSASEEGVQKGLSWIPGTVKKLLDLSTTEYVGPHLPHMGWNSVAASEQSPLFSGVNARKGFYFLHNYFFECSDTRYVDASAEYLGFNFPCAVRRDNVFGVQFHPEKSHDNGIRLLRNFAEYRE